MNYRRNGGLEVAEHFAREFNKRVPVGTRVRYYPISGEEEFVETTTRTEARGIRNGDVLVHVVGQADGVRIDNVQVV